MRKLSLSLVHEKFPVRVPECLSLTTIFIRSFGQCFFFSSLGTFHETIREYKDAIWTVMTVLHWTKEQEEPVFPKNKALWGRFLLWENAVCQNGHGWLLSPGTNTFKPQMLGTCWTPEGHISTCDFKETVGQWRPKSAQLPWPSSILWWIPSHWVWGTGKMWKWWSRCLGF